MNSKKILVLSVFLLLRCGSSETMESKDLNEDRIYRDYKVTYNDLNNELDVFAQFRAGGANGTTVRLSDDSNIKLNDSKLMTHDGNEDFIALNGTYYKTVVKVCFENLSAHSISEQDQASYLDFATIHSEPSSNTGLFYLLHQRNSAFRSQAVVASTQCHVVVIFKNKDQYPFLRQRKSRTL